MEGILALVENAARFVAIFGGALAAVFVAYTGILWMMSSGDPQRVAQARGALIGVLVGLIIVGMAMIIPRLISEAVIEPSGGQRVAWGGAYSGCDANLRRHLVVSRTANNATRVQALISEVQARYEDCDPVNWNPVPIPFPATGTNSNSIRAGKSSTDCIGGDKDEERQVTMGGVLVPKELRAPVGSKWKVRDTTYRDAFNNILILWDSQKPPSDSAACWVYFARFGTWQFGYFQ